MTKTLDVCHLRADLGSFEVFLHLLGGEINHEALEGHSEFRFVLSLYGTLAIWGARAGGDAQSATGGFRAGRITGGELHGPTAADRLRSNHFAALHRGIHDRGIAAAADSSRFGDRHRIRLSSGNSGGASRRGVLDRNH